MELLHCYSDIEPPPRGVGDISDVDVQLSHVVTCHLHLFDFVQYIVPSVTGIIALYLLNTQNERVERVVVKRVVEGGMDEHFPKVEAPMRCQKISPRVLRLL